MRISTPRVGATQESESIRRNDERTVSEKSSEPVTLVNS